MEAVLHQESPWTSGQDWGLVCWGFPYLTDSSIEEELKAGCTG